MKKLEDTVKFWKNSLSYKSSLAREKRHLLRIARMQKEFFKEYGWIQLKLFNPCTD